MERKISDDERQLMTHVTMFGSDAYPIRKLSAGHWAWDRFYGVNGAPTVFKTKRAAVAAFNAFLDILRELLGQEAFDRAFADLVARRIASGLSEEEATKSAWETVRELKEAEASRAA